MHHIAISLCCRHKICRENEIVEFRTQFHLKLYKERRLYSRHDRGYPLSTAPAMRTANEPLSAP